MQPIFGTRLLLGPPRFPFSINSHFPFETFLIYRRESRQKECLRVGIWSVGRLWAENWEPLKLGFDWTSFKLGFSSATLKLGFDWTSFKLGFDWASLKLGLNLAPLKLGFYWRASNSLIEKKLFITLIENPLDSLTPSKAFVSLLFKTRFCQQTIAAKIRIANISWTIRPSLSIHCSKYSSLLLNYLQSTIWRMKNLKILLHPMWQLRKGIYFWALNLRHVSLQRHLSVTSYFL